MTETKIVKLEDICDIIAGQSPPSSTYNKDGDGLPFFQGKADFGKIHPKTRIWCNKPRKVAEKGDILISVRAPVGPTNVCDQQCCIGRGLSAIRPRKDVDQQYLLFYLRKVELEISNKGRGSTFSAITQKDLKSIKIPLPPIEEQKRIVRILDQADSLRQKRQKAISLLDDYLKAVFLEMFGDPVTNPKGWGIKSLKEITSKIGSGATPRGGKNAYKTEGVSLIRSLNIHDDKFLHKNLAFIDDKQAVALANVKVELRDVLLNITGASVCRCAIVVDSVLPARVNQHVAIIRPKKEILNSYYLLHLLISFRYKKKLIRMATAGGATREALTKLQIEQSLVPVPSIELQNKFASIVEGIKSLKHNMTYQAKELELQFQALMKRSFR
ncbi:MAG: restriction endonuclease subunit S [Candidatus Peregrinibacteria bacterium]